MKLIMSALAILAATTIIASPASAEDQRKGDPYTLSECAISSEALGSMGEPITLIHEGREIKFCCSGCPPRFEKDPAQYLSKIDEKIIAQQGSYYPLTTDIVTGAALGKDAVDFVYFNRLVRFASPDSVAKFEKDAATYLAKLDEAVIAKQKDTYPLDVCPIAEHKPEGDKEPVNVVIANRLVRLCCENCRKDLYKDPVAVFSKIDVAAKKK